MSWLVLVHWLGLFLPTMRDLCPHLAYILQDHVRMTVEGLDAGQNLAVVAAIDKDLHRGIGQVPSKTEQLRLPRCLNTWHSTAEGFHYNLEFL